MGLLQAPVSAFKNSVPGGAISMLSQEAGRTRGESTDPGTISANWESIWQSCSRAGKDAYFARTLGVNNLRSHFNNIEKQLRRTVGHEVADVSGHIAEVQDFLAADEIFKNLVVQRSRAMRARAKCVPSSREYR